MLTVCWCIVLTLCSRTRNRQSQSRRYRLSWRMSLDWFFFYLSMFVNYRHRYSSHHWCMFSIWMRVWVFLMIRVCLTGFWQTELHCVVSGSLCDSWNDDLFKSSSDDVWGFSSWVGHILLSWQVRIQQHTCGHVTQSYPMTQLHIIPLHCSKSVTPKPIAFQNVLYFCVHILNTRLKNILILSLS